MPASRRTPLTRLLSGVLAVTTLALVSEAADWPQWRGPYRDGKSAETGLLRSWPENGPPLAFRAEGLGSGYSSVAVEGDHIFTLGDIGRAQYAICLKRSDGTTIWKSRIGRAWTDRYRGTRSTPTVDGDRIYVLSTNGELFCLRRSDGEAEWSHDLGKDFGGAMMKYQGQMDWRFSESPLIDGDRVIVTPGAKSAALVALDKNTGKEIWRTAIPDLGEKGVDGAGYASVVISEACGVRQYVQLIGRGVIGVDAATGNFLWGYNGVANGTANIATPIVHGNQVFASTGYETGSALLDLSKSGEKITAREVYFLEPRTMQNHHGEIILHEGFLYTGTGHNKGFPLCVEMKSGAVKWGPIRNKGRDSAAVTFADGHLYFRYQDGLMVLVEATPAEYREKGSFMIPDVEMESWAQPVIAGGRLWLREQENLFCYDIRAGDR